MRCRNYAMRPREAKQSLNSPGTIPSGRTAYGKSRICCRYVPVVLAEITGVHTLNMKTPAGHGLALHVITNEGSLHLAVSNAEQWRQLLAAQTAQNVVAEKEPHAGSR